MFVFNTRKDRDGNGKRMIRTRNRNYFCEAAHWTNKSPRWWVNCTRTRPLRRDNQYRCNEIVQGAEPDGITFATKRSFFEWYY